MCQVWQAVVSTSMDWLWYLSVNSISALLAMICMFNFLFPSLLLTLFAFKQLFCSVLALKRAGLSLADVHSDVPYSFYVHACVQLLSSLTDCFVDVICLSMCQWGTALSCLSQRLVSQTPRCLFNVHMFLHQSTNSVVNRTVWQMQICTDEVRCSVLKELDCFTGIVTSECAISVAAI